jgi:toxin ParE1/3/4
LNRLSPNIQQAVIKLRLTPAARRDLVEIRIYSREQFGSNVADQYFRGFNQAFARLRAFPEVGVEQTGYREPFRSLLCGKHQLFYTFDGDLVLIARIIHVARNATALLN